MAAVYKCLLHNSLALNPGKSEAAMCSTIQYLVSVSVAGTRIALANHIKSLRICFDIRLSFDQYIREVCKECIIHGLYIHVHAVMSVNMENMVSCTMVSARLDYCEP